MSEVSVPQNDAPPGMLWFRVWAPSRPELPARELFAPDEQVARHKYRDLSGDAVPLSLIVAESIKEPA